MTVSIVDNSIEIISRMRELLSEIPGIKIIQHAVTYQLALEQVKETNPHIVLLDIHLPENLSYKLLKEIKDHSQQIVVIVLSIQTDDRMRSHCETLGADYFFDKYHEFEKIPDIIKRLTIL